VDFVDRPHGRYLFEQDYGYIWGDFSFDYDYDTHEYLIYDGAGLKQAVRYDDANEAVIVRDFVNSQESGVYERTSSGEYYSGYSSIFTYVTDGLFNFMHYVKKF